MRRDSSVMRREGPARDGEAEAADLPLPLCGPRAFARAPPSLENACPPRPPGFLGPLRPSVPQKPTPPPARPAASSLADLLAVSPSRMSPHGPSARHTAGATSRLPNEGTEGRTSGHIVPVPGTIVLSPETSWTPPDASAGPRPQLLCPDQDTPRDCHQELGAGSSTGSLGCSPDRRRLIGS